MTTCDHKWKWIKDWYGDPTIPYGVCRQEYMQCELCDEIDDEAEKPEPDPDYLRDRMLDDKWESWEPVK